MIRVYVQSVCGGCGSTWASANLAMVLSNAGQSVLVRTHSNSFFGMHFEGMATEGTDQALRSQRDRRGALVNTHLRWIELDSGAGDMNPSSLIVEHDYTTRGTAHDIEIVDLPTGTELPMRRPGERVLLLTRADALCYRSLSARLAKLSDTDPAFFTGSGSILVNQLRPESPVSSDVLLLMQSSMQSLLHSAQVLHDECVSESLAQGLPLTEYAPYAQSLGVIDLLSEWLLSPLPSHTSAA